MEKNSLLQKLRYLNIPHNVINAFAKVQRENFVPEGFKHLTYDDIPLHIGHNQTISQPSTIAIMLSLLELEKGNKVLEIGSGSGYVLALMSEIIGISGKVFGIEVVPELADSSKINLKKYKNIEVHERNGKFGLSKKAPFDRIIISAALEKIPEQISVQLKENGILIAPVGSKGNQNLIVLQRIKNKFIVKNKIPGFVFVPFVE